jgi:hypothetical protein
MLKALDSLAEAAPTPGNAPVIRPEGKMSTALPGNENAVKAAG